MRTTGAANARLPAGAANARLPEVALFAATTVLLGLTAGFGLGIWLLFARTEGVVVRGAVPIAMADERRSR